VSRVSKGKFDHHVLKLSASIGPSEITLVRGGKRAYLYVAQIEPPAFCAFSGEVALRKLAHAILKEVGDA
jgi:hypothetical protein